MAADAQRLLEPLRQALSGEALAACPDHELLDRFLARGEPDAFAALVRRHGAMVFGVCRRVLGDHQLAEDDGAAVRALVDQGRLVGWLLGLFLRGWSFDLAGEHGRDRLLA